MAPMIVFITVFYNGHVEIHPTDGMLFICENNILVKTKSNFTLDQLKQAILKKICPDQSKTIDNLTYRYPTTVAHGHRFFGGFAISSDDDVETLMDHYQQNIQFGICTPEIYASLVDATPNINHVSIHDSIPSPHFNPSSSQPNIDFPQSNPSSSQTPIHFSPTTTHHDTQPSSSNFVVDINNPPTPPFSMFVGAHDEDVGDFSDNEDEILQREILDEETQPTPTPSPTPIQSFREPVPHYQHIGDMTENNTDEFGHYIDRMLDFTYEDENDIKLKMKFPTKEIGQQFIQTYHLNNSVAYRVDESKPKVWTVVCVHETCLWRCVLRLGAKSGMWTITQLTHPHTCVTTSISQDHRQLTSSLMASHIVPLVRQDPTISVPVLIAQIKERFTYQSSYRKAWTAKQKAIEQIYGNWEKSYNEVTKWLHAFTYFIPDSVYDFQYKPYYENGQLVNQKGVFKRIFWSFGPCIKGFNYCKPVVSVDGTWLYGRYKGCLLLAIAQDGRNNTFPIAYAVVEGETAAAWYFFLSRLRQYVTPQEGLCLISDRHESIKSAVRELNADWKHVYCVSHIAQNFMRHFKNTEARKKLINMAYSMTERSANHYKSEIADLVGPEGVNWIEDIDPEKLLQSRDGGSRWGHMTTNLAECINNVLKGVRNLPISSLIEATYFRMNEVFVNKGTQAEAILTSGTVYSEKLLQVLGRNIDVSKTHSVSIHDRARQIFRVKELIRPRSGRPSSAFVVNLRDKTCQCGEFQALHFPCSHAIAACAKCSYDHMLFIDDVFKIENVFNTYLIEFPPLPAETSWPDFNTLELQHDPEKRRDKKGRPQSTRIRTEMDQREGGRQPKRCGICRNEGHNRSNCPNRT